MDVDGSGGKCSLGQVAFGRYNAIVELIGVGPKDAVDRYFLAAPLGSSMIGYGARMRIAPGSLGDLIPGGYVTEGSAITLYDHRSRLIRGDPASEKFAVLLQDPRWFNIDWIAAAGDTLLLGTATNPERSGFIPVNSRTPIPLLDVPPGGGTSPVVVADERLYWAEGRGRDKNNRYDEIDLWTGPLPVVAPFTPRRIAGTDQRYMMQLHAGGERVAYLTHAADAKQVRELVVVDVADGGSRRVATTPRGPVLGILGLTRDEVLLTVATPGAAPGRSIEGEGAGVGWPGPRRGSLRENQLQALAGHVRVGVRRDESGHHELDRVGVGVDLERLVRLVDDPHEALVVDAPAPPTARAATTRPTRRTSEL